MATLFANGTDIPVVDVEQLWQELRILTGLGPFTEISLKIDHGEQSHALMVLVNGDLAWLMYLLNQDEVMLRSVNPHYHGNPESTVEFRLANGQQDRYPESWLLPTETALRALEQFYENPGIPASVSWLPC